MKKAIVLILALGMSFSGFAKTLDETIKRGHLECGVSQGLAGFSFANDDGTWTGLDVDICRAVAAAIFKDGNKVKFNPLSAKDRFLALQSGEIDVLSRNTTWTYTRDVALGLEFIAVTYYDGQGFMVPKTLGVKSVKELSGATICTQTGTTTELNVADYFRTHNLKYRLVSFENANEVVSAYNSGRCDVLTTDRSGLAAQKLKLSNPDAHIVLPEIISKEPLAPVVRHNDNQWADIVRWVVFGLITAEELEITSSNVKDKLNSSNPNIKRLLGTEGNLGKSLGLETDFMVHVIKEVGNYAEIFDRNVGDHSQLKLSRGLNDLWNKNGIMYAPPFR